MAMLHKDSLGKEIFRLTSRQEIISFPPLLNFQLVISQITELQANPWLLQEAVFVGRADGLIACGSDDGRVFIYCAETGLLLRALHADEDVANCVQVRRSDRRITPSFPQVLHNLCLSFLPQPHPHCAILATSGIENVVRIWSTGPEPSGQQSEALREIIAENQVGCSGLEAIPLEGLD